MKNRMLRKELIQNGTFKKYLNLRRNAYQQGLIVYENGKFDTDYYGISQSNCEECERIRKCQKEQREKVQNHLEFLFNKSRYHLFFVTFSFSNETLDKTTAKTRKRIIRRLLSNADDYIINIDYGYKNLREHYHCVIALKKDSYGSSKNKYGYEKISLLDDYKLGNYDLERIRTGNEDMIKIARYIAKLTMHSIKVDQKYISVKKGSDYQKYKKAKSNYERAVMNRLPNAIARYEDEMQSYAL